MSVLSDDLVRCNAIRATRSRAAKKGVMSTVLQAQFLFWAWAFGWTLGPSPLRLSEIGAGALFTFAVGALVSWPFTRRRIEAGVRWRTKLREGRKKRRLAFFEDYLTIDDEIVLRSLVRSAAIDDDMLRVAYAAVFDGHEIVRLFQGEAKTMTRVRNDLETQSAWFDREASEVSRS